MTNTPSQRALTERVTVNLATGLILVFTSPVLFAQSPPPTPALKAELKQYYDQKGRPKAWTTALSDLSSTDEKKRNEAAEKLVAVLAQTKADESDGTSPWRGATPYWGSNGDNPARNFRRYLLHDLMQEPAKPGGVPILRWYLFEESQFDHQTAAMKVLKPIATNEANALRMEVIKARHENAWVLAAALMQAREQKLAVSDEVLTEFAKHHRPSIRTVAAEWLKAEKKPIPAFDAAKAMRSEAVKKIVGQLTALWPDIPAENATPLYYRQFYLRDDGVTVDHTPEVVWPLSESAKVLNVVHLNGRFRTYDLSTRNEKPKKARDSTWRTDPADIEKEVKAIAAIRADGNPDFAFALQGGLASQFNGNGPSLKELLLGIWLFKANRYDLAATLLLPAFDTAESDAAVVDIARNKLAIIYGQEMLGAFTYGRDYPEALRLAILTEKLYPRTIYSEHAKRLVRELPLRKDDFQAFALPTAKEWAALKPTLSREKQIVYLCEHLRLLNCFQWSQPGGVNYHDPQFKEPGGHWPGDDKSTPVINPLCELAGDSGGGWHERPKSDGLKLTLADVPTLATQLKDDWTMVMVSYWRNFHPSREIHYTRHVIAGIINDAAKQDICRVDDMAKMSPQEIETHIKGIQWWSRERAGKTEADLHLEALEKTLREDKCWSWDAEKNAQVLVRLNDHRVIATALIFLERKEVESSDVEAILSAVGPLDPAKFKPYALKLMTLDVKPSAYEWGAQFWAACLVIAADESKIAFDQLEILIAGKVRISPWIFRYAFEVLTKAKNERAKQVIGKLITSESFVYIPLSSQNKRVVPDLDERLLNVRRAWVPKFYKGNHRFEILKIYDNSLESQSFPTETPEDALHFREIMARELMALLKDFDKDLKTIADKPGEPREKIPDLKKWIAAKLAETKQ
jgi:hypothetical protein